LAIATADNHRQVFAAARPPRILVVDDEAPIRTFAERVLRDGGYDPVGASDGSEALRIVEAQTAPFDLFVIDMMMPNMIGSELARQLRHANPDVKVLYFTGHCDQLFLEKTTLWEHEAFVEKPVTPNGLLEAVSLMLFGDMQGLPR
jgi:two-component system, cell cycle sensor histidine kinase and response regulator CckA